MALPLQLVPGFGTFDGHVEGRDVAAVAQALRDALGETRLAIVQHGSDVDRTRLDAHLRRHLRGAHILYIGAGPEVEPTAIGAVGTPTQVRVAARVFPSIARITYARGRAMLASLARDLDLREEDLSTDRHLLFCMSEGSTGGEELLAAAMASAGPGLHLVGGTYVAPGLALDDRALVGGAAVLLLESTAPIETFMIHPFQLTTIRAVVTRCDPSARLIHALDGQPATARFAEISGIGTAALEARLRETLLLPHQLGWVVGGQLVARPIVGIHGDSLEVGGAIENGTVLRVLKTVPDVGATLVEGVRGAIARLRVPAGGVWLAFDHRLMTVDDWERAHEALGRLGASVLRTEAQQYGPVHTCLAVTGLVWGQVG